MARTRASSNPAMGFQPSLLDEIKWDSEPTDAAPISLPLDAFVRSIAVNRHSVHSLFLGAGASISSGIPSAEQCLWDWKRTIFLSNNPGLEKQFSDSSLPSIRRRLQEWFDSEGRFPPNGSSAEYGFYAAACYPLVEDRRRFFASLSQGRTPHVGYQITALLAESGMITSVWSTNFDGLASKAMSGGESLSVIEVGLDSAHRIDRPVRKGEVLCVSLHGDYRYDALKNTSQELRDQDALLRKSLIEQAPNTTTIVCGYSGRDDSILGMFAAAYSQPGKGRLFWCGFSESEPPKAIGKVIKLARQNGHEAYYVPSLGFDDLMFRLGLSCLAGTARDRALEISMRHSDHSSLGQRPFRIDSTAVNGILRSNAFAIETPSEILQVDADLGPGPGVWARVQQWTEGHNVVAVPFNGKVLALGTLDDVREAFRHRLKGEIERTPILPHELDRPKGAITSLLTQALVRTLAVNSNLSTDGKELVWTSGSTTRVVDAKRYLIHDAALLFLRRYGGKQYLVIKPTLRVTTAAGTDAPFEAVREIKRAVLGKQWNKAFSEAVENWRKRLLADTDSRLEFPPNSGSTFYFRVASISEHIKLSIPESRWSVRVPSEIAPRSTHRGIEFPEPSLLFARRGGESFAKDTHPIRGLVQNQPYDFSLTERGLAAGVNIAVVCPTRDSGRMAEYLARLHQPVKPDTKQEYLLPYPGFAQAFGTPLDIPGIEMTAWSSPSEPLTGAETKQGAAYLAAEIIRCIDAIHATRGSSVILIYVPTRWAQWERYEFAGESFDLHNFVKAYAVQKGLATGFIRERTLNKPHQGEILWWLSISLYAKAMRTPWALENLDTDVAFMGLGFSLERSRPLGQHVIVGCSHIYSSDGRGLRYRLSKLENCVVRRGNPYMSKDEARMMGEGARQLFFESNGSLPQRLAIHKRTPFSQDEMDGLRQGTGGINQVDMLEITEDPAIRCMATRVYKDTGIQDHAFPVRRGTAVVLDDKRALLWVHGAAEAVQTGKQYYLGKSRIPAPVLITRHSGSSPLGIVAKEILGLSKMNWNNPDLYSKLPATIDSSNTIARIGSLLERFGPLSYDYRLFI